MGDQPQRRQHLCDCGFTGRADLGRGDCLRQRSRAARRRNRFAEGAWSAAAPIADASSGIPAVAVNPDGEALAVWHECPTTDGGQTSVYACSISCWERARCER